MSTTTVVRADASQRSLLERLWLMFRHDMSEFRGILPDAEGRFRSERLDAALNDPGWAVYVIEFDGRPVGFAIVRGLDRSQRVLSAFFVVRGVRRTGIGIESVRRVLGSHPGGWSVAFQHDNPVAVAFWRRVAEDVAGHRWTETSRPVPDRDDLPPDVWIEFEV